MSRIPTLHWYPSSEGLAEIASDSLGALDLRVLLHMMAYAQVHTQQSHGDEAFYLIDNPHFPEGQVGCFVFSGKRTEVATALNVSRPTVISRSIKNLGDHGYLLRSVYLQMRFMFSFFLHPRLFRLQPGEPLASNPAPPAALEG